MEISNVPHGVWESQIVLYRCVLKLGEFKQTALKFHRIGEHAKPGAAKPPFWASPYAPPENRDTTDDLSITTPFSNSTYLPQVKTGLTTC